MRSKYEKSPLSPYREFVLRTKEGHRRLKKWISLIIHSFEGKEEDFFRDEEKIGYLRAIQGFPLDVSQLTHLTFHQTLWEILQAEDTRKGVSLIDLLPDLRKLNEILFKGHNIAATSFLKTREELIREKVTYLQQIYDFTREIMTIFDLQGIINLALKKMVAFFKVDRGLLFLYRDHRIQGLYSFPCSDKNRRIREIMEKTLREGIPFFMDEDKKIHRRPGSFNRKRLVSIPIQVHGHCYGTLALYNQRKGFEFMDKELGLLHQFVYIIAAALENSFMLEEIDRSHQELRFLTKKMITVQEDERKRLAADIHDTIAQILTGISYKIQLCKELAKKNPRQLQDQLNKSIKMLNQAIDQSKDLMTSLRPDLIDMMGLVPALKRLIKNFQEETGIRIMARLPKKVQMPSEVNICLFRVAQEALTNVHKHAGTKTSEFRLQKTSKNLILVVADAGKGFDGPREVHRTNDANRLGLVCMKERLEAVGGSLMVHAGINSGCRVEAKIPIRRGKT